MLFLCVTLYYIIGCCCKWFSKNVMKRIPTDDDNRLIISIKFGLLCVKPYLIMLTKDQTYRMVYQILQSQKKISLFLNSDQILEFF